MDAKINISKILKDKPEGTKLWTDMFGSVTLYVVTDACDAFQVKHHNKELWFDKDGKLYKEGVLCIYPSKSMRDWSKFAWKPGDVLVNKDGDVHIIFDRFEDDAYKNFHGQYYLWEEEGSIVNFEENEDYMQTSEFYKANKEEAQTYINTIEERLGGKLNMETLEIEKAQPEFKDGDIITFKDRIIIIYNNSIEKYPNRTEIYYHACLKEGELTVNEYLMSCGFGEGWYSSTEEEKQQLFDALEKEGKAWDAEKKQIENIKKELQFKPFEKVLVRDSIYDVWRASFFSHIKEDDERYVTTGLSWKFCIPYEGNEHLLGTTDNFE